MVVEAFRQGTLGAALNWRLESRPWDFSLQEIRMPVDVWHGEEDVLVSIDQARLLMAALPNGRSHFCPNEGHLLIVNRLAELLVALAE